MNKFFNKSILIVLVIGLVATIFLIVIFQSSLVKKTDQSPSKEKVTKEEGDKIKTDVFADNDLGVTFQYPVDLQIVTNGVAPTNQPLWLEVTSYPVSEILKEKYWQENLAKLAIGEIITLPGDLYIQKTALKAMAGDYPVVIYTELSYKNCSENYKNKLIALINDKLVALTLHHAPGLLAADLSNSTSTTELMADCENKNLAAYDDAVFVENINNEKISDNLKISINYFTTILSSFEVTKVKSELSASSTSAIIDLPSISKSGNLTLGIDEVVFLQGDEALEQMKNDKACEGDCQLPAEGYVVNQTKKYKTYDLDFNPVVIINYSNSTSTPAQLTKVSLPILIDYLKQNNNEKLVFDVFFDDTKEKIVGLKQK